MNEDEKTIARGRVERCEKPNISLLYITPVRGYEKETSRLNRQLERMGLALATTSTFEESVADYGRKPGDYSSKLRVELDESMTSQKAAKMIFVRLLDTIELNEPGIREDLDTEFLHDFRVAIRRTRSGLSMLKKILPIEVVERFGPRFAELGKASNRLRDLDVYLLDRENYTGMISGEFGQALDPLFDALARARESERAALVAFLDGTRYRHLLGDWRDALSTFGTPDLETPESNTPVGSFSRRLIARRYDRVVRAGARIADDSPDEMFHRLRIRCKRLRYLLEFFISLYPADEIGKQVRQLKRLQDNLGEFNDLSVQRLELAAYLEGRMGDVPTRTAAAVGALVSQLSHRQREIRQQFSEAFESFAGPDNGDRFGRLFG
jgi:CHAD domain-containing protein